MIIREYTVYREDVILRLYTGVGWTAYIENMPALRRGYENSLLVLAAYEAGTGIYRDQGHEVLTLSPMGISQIERAARDDRLKGAELIITSPFGRAMEWKMC